MRFLYRVGLVCLLTVSLPAGPLMALGKAREAAAREAAGHEAAGHEASGHDFSRAADAAKSTRASAPEVDFFSASPETGALSAAFSGAVAPRITPAPLAPAPAQVRPPQPNAGPAYTLPPDKRIKAEALARIRNTVGFAGALWGLAVLWLLLATRTAARLDAWLLRVAPRRWIQGLLYFAILFVVTAAANLPLEIYGHSVSLRYGISVEGWGAWLTDQGKALGLTLAIGAPVLLLFNWIVRRWPRRYWLAAWLVTLPLIVLSAFAEPLFEPIFNTYEPLARSNPALAADLERVVARTGTDIPLARMFLMKASLKTNGLNAYVSGIGATKRVVVWDTTAGRIPNDQVLFIFAHESGHYVLHHIPKGMAGSAVFLFFVYWACARFAGWMLRRFGPGWNIVGLKGAAPMATRTGFLVLLFAASVTLFLLEPAGNAFSRHFEHEADVYGQEAMHGIVPDPQKTAVAAFNSLGEAWLDDPAPNPYIEFWTESHPSIQQRATFARDYDPWKYGGSGRFFKK